MPYYAYRAIHASGRLSRGERDAANENELAHDLSQAGLELIDARLKKERALRNFLPRKGISRRELAEFCQRLSGLLKAGISLPDALLENQSSTDNRILADALAQISKALANGKGVADSFALFPNLFSPIFLAIVGAGEKTGDMSAVFDLLARDTSAEAEARERLSRALRYPAFLFFVAGSATAFMMTAVVPQIVQFLNGIQGTLPVATRMLVSVSSLIATYGGDAVFGLALLATSAVFARKYHPPFALTADKALLRLPVLGGIVLKSDTARFARSFSILFRSGCDMASCLRQAAETMSNRALQSGIDSARQRIMDGASLSHALNGVLPPAAAGILRTGEKSGDLIQSLDAIAAAYDREAAHATDTFLGMLEPSLTLAIGAVMAWTVLAVLGPLYGSLSVLGSRL